MQRWGWLEESKCATHEYARQHYQLPTGISYCSIRRELGASHCFCEASDQFGAAAPPTYLAGLAGQPN
jgi:hypothetical protein